MINNKIACWIKSIVYLSSVTTSWETIRKFPVFSFYFMFVNYSSHILCISNH